MVDQVPASGVRGHNLHLLNIFNSAVINACAGHHVVDTKSTLREVNVCARMHMRTYAHGGVISLLSLKQTYRSREKGIPH